MILRFDPEGIDRFKAQIRGIPGYPAGEDLPIREMVFESGALWRLSGLLLLAGMKPDQPLSVVMDQTPMKREGKDLKSLILEHLQHEGWQTEVIWLEPDITGQVHTDFSQINYVKARLQTNSAVLSVGSGTVTDIAKHACHVYQQEHTTHPLPFVVYPTANSVSAYTSNMAPTFVDGANELTIYARIVLPLCGPALAALTVLSALWRWNDVLWPLLVISDRDLYTITFGLAISGRSQGIFTGVALATSAIAILPLMILYLFLQRYIIRGIMLTGLKG